MRGMDTNARGREMNVTKIIVLLYSVIIVLYFRDGGNREIYMSTNGA